MRHGWASPLALAWILAACSSDTSSEPPLAPPPPEERQCPTSITTEGELEVLEFRQGEWWFAGGLTLDLVVAVPYGTSVPPVAVASAAPAVAQFSLNPDGTILMNAHAPGEARLEISAYETGEIIDANIYTVAPVHRIESDREGGVLIMNEGGSAMLRLDVFDEDDCPMVSRGGGIQYAIQGVPDVGIAPSSPHSMGELELEYFESNPLFTGPGVGIGAIVLTTQGNATLTIPLEVVDASAVAEVDLTSKSMPWTPSATIVHGVSAHAYTADNREIEDPKCAWTLAPSGGPVKLASVARNDVLVQSSSPGTATLTCEIGTASDSLDVIFE